jgi:hypothetical protein
MSKAKIDLTDRLQKRKRRKYKKLAIALAVPLVLGGISFGAYSLLPWSFQLFLRWVFRGGDLHSIPEKFHTQLNELCRTATNSAGEVKLRNSLQNIELSDSLGSFQCTLVNGGQEWLIRDHKSFNSPDEAIMGTELAVFLASILGTDYSYDIEARIQNLNPTPPVLQPDKKIKKQKSAG